MGIAELPAILCEQHTSLVRILPKWTLGDVTLIPDSPAALPATVDRVLEWAAGAIEIDEGVRA